jgi:hypothetical protein
MRALAIDFVAVARRVRWTRNVLALIAVAFAIDTGHRYVTLKSEVDQKSAAIARAASTQPASRPALNNHTADEYNFARQTLGRLSTPWDRLFDALEAAHSKDVVLLSVEPDADNRTVTITGEAKDYLGALGYLANLAQQRPLKRVHLVHHEVRKQLSLRPLLFSISAGWEEP